MVRNTITFGKLRITVYKKITAVTLKAPAVI